MNSKYSNTISKNQLLLNYSKIDQFNYKCNICNKVYKTPNGGVGNLRVHYATHTRVNDDVTGKRKRQTLLTPLQDDGIDPDNPVGTSEELTTKTNQPQKKASTQLLMPNVISNINSITDGKKAKQITNSIIYYFCKDNVSFKTIENEGFKHMLNTICPLYKPPGRDTIARQIDEIYEVMAGRFQNQLSKVSFVSVTTDVWTETMQMKSFLGITIHLIEERQLKTQNIGTVELFESHTAEYIGHTLEETLKKWGIGVEKVVAVVTDSGANMKKAIVDTFGAIKHISCTAHTVNLVVEKAIDKTQEITLTGKRGGVPVILSKIREIIKYFKKSSKACDSLRNCQRVEGKKEGKFLKPILDVRTRWNSSFYMLERFILLANHFSQILLTHSGKNIPEMITGAELRCIEEITSLLKPMEQLTRELSTEKFVMSSKVIPIILCTKNEIIQQIPSDVTAKQLKSKLIEELEYRFGSLEQSSMLAICTMLDTRFKDMHFKNPLTNSKIQEDLVKIMDESTNNCDDQIICSTENDANEEDVRKSQQYDLWGLHRTLEQEHQNKRTHLSTSREELKSYLHQNVMALNTNPLDAWENNKAVYPKLYNLAQKYLTVPGTSVPSERLFSKAGATMSQTRNRLTGSKLSKLLFLQSLDLKNFV